MVVMKNLFKKEIKLRYLYGMVWKSSTSRGFTQLYYFSSFDSSIASKTRI